MATFHTNLMNMLLCEQTLARQTLWSFSRHYLFSDSHHPLLRFASRPVLRSSSDKQGSRQYPLPHIWARGCGRACISRLSFVPYGRSDPHWRHSGKTEKPPKSGRLGLATWLSQSRVAHCLGLGFLSGRV